MVDQSFTMNVNDTLELDYLIEEISRDTIEITDEPTEDSFSVSYISRETGVFNPSNTGTYKLDIKGQTIKIEVTDIPDSGVSRWTFDNSDTNSGTAVDVWGNNDGTINGAMTGVSGANQTYSTNEAYDFDGSDDYVSLPINVSDTQPTGLSIAAWWRPDDSTAQQMVFGNAVSATGEEFAFRNASGGGIDFFSLDDPTVYGVTGAGSTTDNTWVHAVGTYSQTNGYTVYKNGSQVGSDTTTTFATNTVDEFIGARQGRGDLYFGGEIDDVRYYDKELSATEVSNLYNTGSI